MQNSFEDFKTQIAQLDDQKLITDALKQIRERLLSCSPVDSAWIRLNAISSNIVDAVLTRLFELECAKVGIAAMDCASGELAIVATGGYGRRELAPYSDIDVTFMPGREDDEQLNVVIKGMFQAVMDVFLYGAGMKVGYAYRLIADIGQIDHQTQTALLDSRLVTGNPEIYYKFEREFRRQLLVADFLFQKNAERIAVVAKYGANDDPFVIEPNIKEGSGGLRDAQTVEWFGQVLCGVKRDAAIAGIEQIGLISERQRIEFEEIYEFLSSVRNALHCTSREARDILTTEKQEAVAKLLGYDDTTERPGVETFMLEFYSRVGTMRSLTRKVMERSCDSLLSLGVGGLSSQDRKIILSDPQASEKDDVLPLHACELAQAYQLRFGDKFDEDVQTFLEARPESKRYDLCGRVLARILSSQRGVAASLQWLADVHVLEWVIPEFRGLRYLIPYDASHDYTVGEHSLRVVQFLEYLRTSNDPRFAEYVRVWQEIDAPEALFLAGLVHDIGKQWPGEGSHGDSGADAALKIARRLGWTPENCRRVEFLVRNHLLMAETSRLRDLRLDETIRDFTKTVDELPLLHMLFLLTCADTHQVGAGVWTEMKGKFLSELFNRTEAALMSNQRRDDDGQERAKPFVADLAKHRERIKRQLAQQNLPADAIHEHTARMSAQYLLNTPLEEMYLQMAMINRLRATSQPILDFKTEFGSDYTELTLITYDDPNPGLLAKIYGVLYALDVNLHASQVFTRDSSVRIAIDTLWVDFRGKPLSSAKKGEVQETIRNVLTGQQRLSDLFEHRKKPDKQQIIHAVKIDDQVSDRYSLIEIRAPLEPGVIYRLARALSEVGWNIHSARLSLWGSRVRSAFYITEADGQKVKSSDVVKLASILPREDVPGRRKPMIAG